MSRFKRIKNKTTKKFSVSIDEKIAALNKQLKKTGMLSEINMTTSNIYPEVSEIPNQDLADFEAVMTGGQRLGFSGADGNSAGNAAIGDEGVALSPPHPVTGLRVSAAHVRDGTGGTTPLKPGQTTTRGFSDNPPVYTMGSCLWFYDSDFDNGVGQPAGKWCNLEYSNFDATAGQWFFWDTIKPPSTLAGFYFANTDLSQHPCGDISDLIDGLNFPNGSLGPEKLPVLTQKGLETEPIYPGPIANLFGLGARGFEWMSGRATGGSSPTSPKDPGDPKTTETKTGMEGEETEEDEEEKEKQKLLANAKRIDADNQRLANQMTSSDPRNQTAGLVLAIGGTYIVVKSLYTLLVAAIAAGYSLYQLQQLQSDFEADWESNIVWKSTLSDAEWEKQAQEGRERDAQEAKEANARVENAEQELKNAEESGNEERIARAKEAYENALKNRQRVINNNTRNNAARSKARRARYGNKDNPTGTFYNSYKPQGDVLSEGVGLGHFEPDQLNVNIEDLRKGIMPEYPKQPPAEMIDGYHQKSPLRPKPLDNEPYVKITKADLIRNHRLKSSEADEMMDTINRLNDYIKKHPEDLIHAQQRYPKDDPRLAELNWKMDQMLNSSEEYLEKNYKFNDKLLKRAIDRTKNNIKLTDPEYVQQHYDELRGTTQGKVINPKPRDIKLKSKLKKHLPQYESKSFFKHVDSKDFKKISERKEEQKRLKLENETALNKVTKERQEYIDGEMLKQKSDWRKDISESDFTNITKGNRIGQTFQHASGATITIDNTMSDPSDQPSQVTLDLGFGEKITVDAPSGNEYGIAGITSHLGASGGGVKELDKKVMQKQNVKTAGEINQQLDASEKASGAESARVEGEKPNFVFGVDDPTKPGVMTDPEEIKMNEKLYKFQKIYTDTVEKNTKIRDDHEKNVLAPYVNKLLSSLKLKTPGTSKKSILYKERQISNEDGTIIVTIDSNDKKVTFTKRTLINGRWSSSEKSFDQPRLRSLPTMPKFLQDWQSQSIDPSFAIQRSEGEILAKAGKVESAFNLVNYYIDNHVKTGAGMDPSRKDIRHDVTNLYTEKSKDFLRQETDRIKQTIDFYIKSGESNAYIEKYVDGQIVPLQPRDISNSIGNAMGFDVDYYKQTGNYRFNSTYKFTSTYDMGIRGKLSFLSGAAQKYVSGQLDGETGMAVQNPMQFQVNIESGKKDTQNIKGTGVKNNTVSSGATTKTVKGIKKPSTKTIQGIKKLSKSKFDGFDRGDLSFKRKKKKDK